MHLTGRRILTLLDDGKAFGALLSRADPAIAGGYAARVSRQWVKSGYSEACVALGYLFLHPAANIFMLAEEIDDLYGYIFPGLGAIQKVSKLPLPGIRGMALQAANGLKDNSIGFFQGDRLDVHIAVILFLVVS